MTSAASLGKMVAQRGFAANGGASDPYQGTTFSRAGDHGWNQGL
jgi:hypothetical protein